MKHDRTSTNDEIAGSHEQVQSKSCMLDDNVGGNKSSDNIEKLYIVATPILCQILRTNSIFVPPFFNMLKKKLLYRNFRILAIRHKI